MIRENQKYLNHLQIFLDLSFILISFFLAYYTRFYIFKDGMQTLILSEMLIPVFAIMPIYYLLYNIFDLYSARRTKPIHIELASIIQTNFIGAILLMVILYIFKVHHFSRWVVALLLLYNLLLSIGSRIVIRLLLRNYRQRGYNLKHCLLIGATQSSAEFIKRTYKNTHWGYKIFGIVTLDYQSNHKSDDAHYNPLITYDDTDQEFFMDIPIIGNLSTLHDILSTKQLDMVMIGDSGHDINKLRRTLRICEQAGLKTQIIPYYYKYIPAKPYMDDLDGLPVIDTRHVPLDNLFKAFSKRTFDIIFSLTAILLISPILLVSAVLTKLSSPGPIFFKQERVGLNRRSFYMYKFRSMRVQTEEEEKAQWTTKDDPRKTKWGSFIRKTSIDEFPQFFNVLKGDMSVVGPRPERPFFVDKFKEDIPRYMIKHQVRPGITGWAQINGFRGDTSIEGRIEHDLYYIENWTFALDLKIIFLTVFKGFVNKNAY